MKALLARDHVPFRRGLAQMLASADVGVVGEAETVVETTASSRRVRTQGALPIEQEEHLREEQKKTAREEGRKEEILGMLRGLAKVAASEVDAPDPPPSEPPW